MAVPRALNWRGLIISHDSGKVVSEIFIPKGKMFLSDFH